MRRIPVQNIQDGMVLAEEVMDDHGEVLLNIGDRLHKTYSSKLEAWGVKEIAVEGVEPTSPEESSPQWELPKDMEERILNRIHHRFANVVEEPLMRKLMALSTNHVMARAAKRYGTKDARKTQS